MTKNQNIYITSNKFAEIFKRKLINGYSFDLIGPIKNGKRRDDKFRDLFARK